MEKVMTKRELAQDRDTVRHPEAHRFTHPLLGCHDLDRGNEVAAARPPF
jgi:hypothetical protein